MNIKIRLEPTDRTDVMCVCCGHFNCTHVFIPHRQEGIVLEMGVCKTCQPIMHAKRKGADND